MRLLRIALAVAGVCGLASAQALTPEDRGAIQGLVGQYAQALGACRAAEFAELFASGTGTFISGFRGEMTGRERLIALVESERQCVSPNPNAKGGAARPAPVVALEESGGKVRGLINLGTAEYQDEYVKTPQGWRFASRTVVTAAEKAAGLDAADMRAIQRLGGAALVDYREPDVNGVSRLMTTGTRITVANGQVTGRVFLPGGGYRDEVYERNAPGQWRVKAK